MSVQRCILLLWVVLGLAVLPATATAQQTSPPVVKAILFYSPTCGHCHAVINDVLVPMREEAGDQLQILGIDVTQPGGQQLYQAAIAHYQIPAARQGVPTLIIGETVLVGSGEIPAQFPGLVARHLAEDGIDWPALPGLAERMAAAEEADAAKWVATPAPADTVSVPPPAALAEGTRAEPAAEEHAAPVYLAYFYDPNCLACTQVSSELERLQAEYAHLVVRTYNVHEEAALNEAIAEKYGVPAQQRLLAPMIFIGDEVLLPEEISRQRLLSFIQSAEPALSVPPWQGMEGAGTAAARIVERFTQFSTLAVAGAGLLDGVNPCAFTTILFFVSYLALVGRKGREILLVGAAFTLAVFLTYLVMGLGLAEVVRRIGTLAAIGRAIYAVTAVICMVLAALSLWDYVQIRRGRLTEIALQLPRSLKRRIHGTIRTTSRTEATVTAAFGAGVVVSIFELACTGQVYLPTIVFVAGVAEMRSLAIAYLVLYNLMFVLPLIVVFAVTYLGTSSTQLTTFFQARAGLVKLSTAALFGVLGVWLAYLVVLPFQ